MHDVMRCIGTVAYLGGLPALLEPFCWAWSALREFNTQFVCGPSEMIHYTRSQFSLHAHARNWLVEEMRGDWLLMLDTDHTFEPDLLLKMLTIMRQHKTPVLTGIYRHKVLPHHPMLWHWSQEEEGFLPFAEYDATVPCFRVDAAGGGCLLVHRQVFASLAEQLHEEPFSHRGKYGEDFSFFLRCREAGIPVYATPHVETHHLRVQAITDAEYCPDWFPASQEIAVGVPQ